MGAGAAALAAYFFTDGLPIVGAVVPDRVASAAATMVKSTVSVPVATTGVDGALSVYTRHDSVDA